jgi:hypothetical protein
MIPGFKTDLNKYEQSNNKEDQQQSIFLENGRGWLAKFIFSLYEK